MVQICWPDNRGDLRHQYQQIKGIDTGISSKLDKELEAPLSNNTTNPGAEMIHFQDTPSHISAMVDPVRLPDTADVAPERQTIAIADKDILAPKSLEAMRRGYPQLQYPTIVQSRRVVISRAMRQVWLFGYCGGRTRLCKCRPFLRPVTLGACLLAFG